MRAAIDPDGNAFLEVSADELLTLCVAIDREIEFHVVQAGQYTEAAQGRDMLASLNRRGRVANRRLAGMFREKAAGHRSLARTALDLRRQLVASPTNEGEQNA